MNTCRQIKGGKDIYEFILITVFLEVLNTDKVRKTMKKTKTLTIFSVCNVTL